MPETTPRLPRVRTATPPTWAAVTDRFYADSFDARSPAALLESAEAFADLSPDEQAFHSAHLAFRQIQALADIHTALKGIETGLARLDPKAIAALQHLPGVRKALVVIARGQQDMLDMLESQGGASVRGEEADNDESDDDDAGDDDVDSDDEDDASDLADAMDTEDEDHGHGDVEVVVPEIVEPGSRGGPTAEDVLAGRGRGAT
jgi:hypothetical protein